MSSELYFACPLAFIAQQTSPKFHDSADWCQADLLVLVKVIHASQSAATLVK